MADLKQTGTITLADLDGQKFYVPAYQRGYRWTKQQVIELLDDIENYAGNKYCLQTVVVTPRDDGSFVVIDGQQRLTTLWLLSRLYINFFSNNTVDFEFDYEGKPDFTKLLQIVRDDVDNNKYRDFPIGDISNHAKGLGNTIDRDCFIKNLETAIDYYKGGHSAVLSKIFDKSQLNRLEFIWYVIDVPSGYSEEAQEKIAIDAFSDINANKIPLTDAELIKSVLLKKIEDEEKDAKKIFAMQWEEIEKGLSDDCLWRFVFNGKDSSVQTRMDYLFEINFGGKPKGALDLRWIYNSVDKELKIKSAQEIWGKIYTVYQTMCDWYSDYRWFHLVGLVVHLSSEGDSAKCIFDLYKNYCSNKKKDFDKALIDKCISLLFAVSDSRSKKGKEKPLTLYKSDFADATAQEGKYISIPTDNDDKVLHLYEDELKGRLEKLNYYDHSAEIRKVLFVYAVAVQVNGRKENERFPFDAYCQPWDIEHIIPKTPDTKADIDKEIRPFISCYKKMLEDSPLAKEQNDILGNLLEEAEDLCDRKSKKTLTSRLEEISKKIEEYYALTIHGIANLTLLDAGINRSYHNESFAQKRQQITSCYRGVQKRADGKPYYLPLGTRLVFNREFSISGDKYSGPQSTKVFDAKDQEAYKNDILNQLMCLLAESDGEK